MYWSNYHSHSIFCDGRSPMEEFVRFAIVRGLRRYGFSAHAPLPFPTAWNMNLDDMPYYISEFYRLKEKYCSEIDLFLGLEVDFINEVFDANHNLYDTKEFDYKISSVHFLDPLPAGGFFTVDGKYYDFEQGVKQLYEGDIRVVVDRFFDISTLMIEKGGFDIVGHVDKISLNGSKYPGFSIFEKWYQNRVGEILQLIKDKGYILEINTKSFSGEGFTYPDVHFFQLVNELDIPIVVGSDCHYPNLVDDGFQQVFRLLENAGFKTMQQLTVSGWETAEFNDRGFLA